MNDGSREIWLAGVDGCPDGWLVVLVQSNGTARPPRVVTTFEEVAFAPEQPAVIAVDVPIGLADHSPPKGRRAESETRSRLGNRKSSVFRIPSRSAVYASVASEPADDRERFFKACDIARKTSEDGKAFAKQGFYILDKVVEVDKFLQSHHDHRSIVYETHPELAFWRLNGNAPLHEPKKRKGRIHPPGMSLRRSLLTAAGTAGPSSGRIAAQRRRRGRPARRSGLRGHRAPNSSRRSAAVSRPTAARRVRLAHGDLGMIGWRHDASEPIA